VRALVKTHIPRWYKLDPIDDVQVLAPMHRGSAGISALNADLQRALNPRGLPFSFGGQPLREGDKIIQTRNNYDLGLFNGDLGRIEKVDTENTLVRATFDGRDAVLERAELSDVQPAYALTIHKSQGSEFPVVVIALLKQHFVMLMRNLVYTAITRGRKKVFIVGEPSAYSMAIRNAKATERSTALKEKLSNNI